VTDFIALCPCRPQPQHTAAALLAAGPNLTVGLAEHGALLRIYDETDRPLLVVEGPLLVQVPGEPARLLDPRLASLPAPVWWIEARAEPGDERAALTASRFAAELAAQTGGVAWP
jgi:hypothetical protein